MSRGKQAVDVSCEFSGMDRYDGNSQGVVAIIIMLDGGRMNAHDFNG